MRTMLRKMLLSTLALSLLLITACGTIVYPERRGQPAGRIDPVVFAMDAGLLILFLVPGVIAFSVDFATGAIYLPPEEEGDFVMRDGPSKSRVVYVEGELTPDRIEEVLRDEVGAKVDLTRAQWQEIEQNRQKVR